MSAEEKLGAWLLPIDKTTSVAIGRYELKYLEYINASVRIPGLPAYCEQGFIWRDQFIPALDLHELITRRRTRQSDGERMAAIIAYENARGEIAVGAIFLQGVPRLLEVHAQQSLAITQLETPWKLLAHAAFKSGDSTYPVLDLRALFDQTPADLLSMH
jgi:chemotaxis signal transduction protein